MNCERENLESKFRILEHLNLILEPPLLELLLELLFEQLFATIGTTAIRVATIGTSAIGAFTIETSAFGTATIRAVTIRTIRSAAGELDTRMVALDSGTQCSSSIVELDIRAQYSQWSNSISKLTIRTHYSNSLFELNIPNSILAHSSLSFESKAI